MQNLLVDCLGTLHCIRSNVAVFVSHVSNVAVFLTCSMLLYFSPVPCCCIYRSTMPRLLDKARYIILLLLYTTLGGHTTRGEEFKFGDSRAEYFAEAKILPEKLEVPRYLLHNVTEKWVDFSPHVSQNGPLMPLHRRSLKISKLYDHYLIFLAIIRFILVSKSNRTNLFDHRFLLVIEIGHRYNCFFLCMRKSISSL